MHDGLDAVGGVWLSDGDVRAGFGGVALDVAHRDPLIGTRRKGGARSTQPQEQQKSTMNTTTTVSIAEPDTFDAAAFAAQALSSQAALAAVLDHTLRPHAPQARALMLDLSLR